MLETNSKDEMVSNARRQRLSTLLDVNCSRPGYNAWDGAWRRRKTQADSIFKTGFGTNNVLPLSYCTILRSDFLLWSYSFELKSIGCSQMLARFPHSTRSSNSDCTLSDPKMWAKTTESVSEMPCRTHRIFISKTCGPFRASCRIQYYLTTPSVTFSLADPSSWINIYYDVQIYISLFSSVSYVNLQSNTV